MRPSSCDYLVLKDVSVRGLPEVKKGEILDTNTFEKYPQRLRRKMLFHGFVEVFGHEAAMRKEAMNKDVDAPRETEKRKRGRPRKEAIA